jgi:hypothetical protein
MLRSQLLTSHTRYSNTKEQEEMKSNRMSSMELGQQLAKLNVKYAPKGLRIVGGGKFGGVISIVPSRNEDIELAAVGTDLSHSKQLAVTKAAIKVLAASR